MVEAAFRQAVRRALAEDRAREDVTSGLLGLAAPVGTARFLAEERIVLCGLDAVEVALAELDPDARLARHANEGDWVQRGIVFASARGSAAALLAAERVGLNFLQHLSGIATATRRAVEAVAGTRARITHTRKTLPGLRELEIYAVKVGGGVANRASLAEAVLWKDNHWELLAGGDVSLADALAQAPAGVEVIVEVEDRVQVEAALAAGVRHLMIDNQPPERFAELVRLAGPGVTIQASGGITGANARAYAEAGADLIAIGALTHSAPAAPIRCEIVPE